MRWLHISDIHYNPDMDGRTSKQLRDQLPAYLQQLERVDEVFVTGDFRHARFQGDTDSVAGASVALLHELAASVGVNESKHIHIIPGNHDLTRFTSTRQKHKLAGIVEKYDPGHGRFDPKDETWLLKRFSFFKRVSDILHPDAPVWLDDMRPIHKYHCFSGYSILYMNTATVCNMDEERGQLVIGNDDLYMALEAIKKENPNAPIIVLAHHTPECFSKNERKAVEALLGDYNVRLYLCGDAHEVWWRPIRNQAFEITMGCIKLENGVQAAFSIGELQPDGHLSIQAHLWDLRMGGWGPYTQFDQSIGKYLPKPTSNGPVMPVNNLEERNISFCGRENELNKIHAVFENSNTVCVKQSIAGLGGVGKTQLALEYAHRLGHEYTDAIWWVNAEKTPKNDLLEFAARFELIPEGAEAAKQMSDEDFIGRLSCWCSRHNSFLFIFDNVENADDIEPYISNLKTGHVFITTRDRKMKLRKIKSIELDVFDVNDAKAFMQQRLPAETIGKEQTLNKLIDDLGRLPLALEQASAYMIETEVNCERYLALLESYGLEVFDSEAARPEDYNSIVTTTWDISFEKLDEPVRQLFNLCAYMAPDNIPLEFFTQGKDNLPQPLGDAFSNMLAVDAMIQILTKYALAKRSGDFLSIHRLVQMVVRKNLAADTQWLACCLNLACAVFGFEWGDKPSMEAFQQYVSHVLEIARHAENMFKEEAEQIKIARIYHLAGYGLEHNGDYTKALGWYKKALMISEKSFGSEHPNTAMMYNNIAGVYQCQGEHTKALEWCSKALEICESVLGLEHQSTATTYNNMACVYQYQGEYEKALEWYYKALAINENALGSEHPSTATMYNNIACVYQYQGEYEKALEWYYKALTIREKVLGSEHPSTATTYNNIAGVYQFQGEYEKALEWYYKALAISEKVLGSEHPYMASAYNNIAGVYQYQGEYEKALELCYKALAICEKFLGAEHSDTAATYNNIACVYQYQGEYEKALEWYYKALAISEKVLGSEHPSTAMMYHNIACVYFNLNKYFEARDLFCRAFVVLTICNLVDHHDTKSSYNNMCACYEKAGGKKENFGTWIKERIETYPMWCDEQ